jgi:hypothetical protein
MLFTLTGRDATFRNEVFVICLDADGTVGGVRPGQRAFLRRASLAGRIKLLFRAAEEAGARKVLDVPAGDRLLFGIVQDSTLQRLMTANPRNRPGLRPVAYFSGRRGNPGGETRARFTGRSVLQIRFEDLVDQDFNDVVLTVRQVRVGR